jgi:hypothetical protein
MVHLFLLVCWIAVAGCSLEKPLCVANCGDKVASPVDPCGKDMK